MNLPEMIAELRTHPKTGPGCSQLTDAQLTQLIHHFSWMSHESKFRKDPAPVVIEPPKFKVS